ncbi:MAG: hypothetical protein GWO24_19230 [Akkermansiaceae bacterium]|nr:hypothetical protein [Akkermansiaceae bacterium]
MASSLAKRAQSMRSRFQQRERDLVGSSIGVATGLVTGAMERRGTLPISVVGLPSKLGLGIVAVGASTMVRGRMGHALRRTGDALLTCYAYNAGKTGSAVAGWEDYVSGDEEDLQPAE